MFLLPGTPVPQQTGDWTFSRIERSYEFKLKLQLFNQQHTQLCHYSTNTILTLFIKRFYHSEIRLSLFCRNICNILLNLLFKYLHEMHINIFPPFHSKSFTCSFFLLRFAKALQKIMDYLLPQLNSPMIFAYSVHNSLTD